MKKLLSALLIIPALSYANQDNTLPTERGRYTGYCQNEGRDYENPDVRREYSSLRLFNVAKNTWNLVGTRGKEYQNFEFYVERTGPGDLDWKVKPGGEFWAYNGTYKRSDLPELKEQVLRFYVNGNDGKRLIFFMELQNSRKEKFIRYCVFDKRSYKDWISQKYP